MLLIQRLLGIVILFLIAGCSSYTIQQQTKALSFPELGSIVKAQGSLWYASTEQVGQPHWETPLKVQVQEIPFNKTSYGTYSNYIKRAGKINSVKYIDSLPYKPKYLRLLLSDKIVLTNRLNAVENKETRAYLEKDSDYRIVSALDITLPDSDLELLSDAETVFLEQDAFRNLSLVYLNGEQQIQLSLKNIQTFDFDLSSFCWGEDRYHNKQVEAILDGKEKCPKGTAKKASKITSDRDYLKF